MKKKHLILDVDGCVLKFDYAFIPILKTHGIEIVRDGPGGWELLGDEYTRKEKYKFVTEVWESELFKELPVIDGFIDFVNWAKDNYKVIYNTTLPIKFKQKRIDNLNKHGLLDDINADIYFAKGHLSKVKIVKDIGGGIAFVDDKPKNVMTMQKELPSITTIWFNYDKRMLIYDEEFKPNHEVHQWEEVKQMLKNQDH